MLSCNGDCEGGLKYVGGRCIWDDAAVNPTLVIMCRVNGYPTDGDTSRIYQLFTTQGSGTNNLFDYFTEMSYGRMDIGTTAVLGWVDSGLPPTSGRYAFTTSCANAAAKAYPNFPFEDYNGIISVLNSDLHIDGGNSGYNTNKLTFNGVTHTYGLINVDTYGTDTEFLSHEMGHSLGFVHSKDDKLSNCGGIPGDYCDRWDEMSAENNYFGYNTYGRQASSFVAAYRIKEGWLLAGEIIEAGPGYDGSPTQIAAINRPEVDGPRVIRITNRTGKQWTVELMTKTRWDASIPESAVLIHELDGNGFPLIITEVGGDYGLFPKGNGPVSFSLGSAWTVTVNSIDETAGVAEVVVRAAI